MANDVKGTLSELKSGKLSKEEYVSQVNKFDSLGKLCEFSTEIVDLAKEITKSNSKSTEALSVLSTQLSAIIADKTISNSEKEYAKRLLDKIFDEIVAQRKADRSDRSFIVKSICTAAVAVIAILAGGKAYGNNKN